MTSAVEADDRCDARAADRHGAEPDRGRVACKAGRTAFAHHPSRAEKTA